MDINNKVQYNDASQLYLYTVHVIEEVNIGVDGMTPGNIAGAENALYYRKGVCIGARSPKINKNKPPAFLTEPLLISNINGSHTFSFKMPRFYYDLSGNKIENDLITHLHNETRILLQYYENIVDSENFSSDTYKEKVVELENLYINGQSETIDENIKTLVFVIKNISEDITGQFFEFECNDIYINELSKVGSQIVMDTELQNNIGSAQDLIQYVLDESNSDWIFEGMESNAKRGLYNFIEQPIVAGRDNDNYWYLFGLSDLQNSVPYLSFFKSRSPKDVLDLSIYIEETSGLFDGGSDFIFYSPIDYSKDRYEINITLSKTTYREIEANSLNNYVERVPIKVGIEDGNSITTITIGTLSDIKAYYEYHGEFLIPQEKTIYDKKAKQFVTPCYRIKDDLTPNTVGKRVEYYRKNGYLITDGGIDNFVSNPNCYSNTNGWTLETKASDAELKVTNTTTTINGQKVEYSALEAQALGNKTNPISTTFTNNLFTDTGSKTQGIINGESFICILKAQYLNGSTWRDDLAYLVPNDNGYSVKIMQQTFSFSGVLGATQGKTLNAVNINSVGFASSLLNANNIMYYDNTQGYYWFKFKVNTSYSQTQINNLIELKDKDGNLNDNNTSQTLLDTLGASITFKCRLNTTIRILDFEVFRLNIVKNKSNEDILIQPEPVSWLSYNSASKPTISSDKLLSNYGTQPYYRYYIAPEVKKSAPADNGSALYQSTVLKYVCRRKITNNKSTGFPLWYLYIIVNSNYLSNCNKVPTFPDDKTTATENLAEWRTKVGQNNSTITGGYIPKKGKFLTATPKLLEQYLYKDSAPNTDKFIFSDSLYFCRHPNTNVLAPCVPGVIEFTQAYTKGTKIENGKEIADTLYLPIAYLTTDLVNKGAGTYLCYDNSFNFNRDYSSSVRKYFKPTPAENAEVTCPEDVIYCDIGTSVKDDIYMPIYTALKVGTVSASNSNAFNIIQKCCETFNCWANFKVQLLSSSLTAPNSFIMKKTISLYDQYYTDISHDFFFDYKANINSIKRTVNSEDITTKTIVKANNNEYGKNGFCTIQRSKYNLSGENFIYNFKYYIKKKMLDETTLNRDMYGSNEVPILPDYEFDINTNYDAYKQECDSRYNNFCSTLKSQIWTINISTTNCFGYIPTLHRINTKAREISDKLGIALTNKNEAYASYLVSTEAISEAEKLKDKASKKLKQYATIDGPKDLQAIVDGVSTWTSADVQKMLQSFSDEVKRFETIIETQKAIRTSTKEVYEKYDHEYKMYSLIANLLEKESLFLQETFENKYHLYIQEGTWTSEDYYDDDKYYLDATSVAYTSGFPKVTYQIDVEPLINIYGQTFFGGTDRFSQGHRLEPGHKTYIRDADYFKDEEGNIFKEEVIISETSKYLDSPEKNTVTVQNFRTQFEDLFQRIAATTANLEFAQGMYARAASLINPDGSLQPSAVEKTFTNVKSISLTTDSSITTGENGIIATNLKSPSEQTQLCGAGLRCTTDGGKTWMTAITGNGINANAITSGQIATDKIFIGDPNNPQFKWDSEGITSFCEGVNSTTGYKYLNYYKFTRLNDLGFYGIDQVHTSQQSSGYYLRSNVTVDANIAEDSYSENTLTSSNLLLNPQCIFYVGWAGFKFKSGSTTSMEGLYFDNTNGLVMRDSGGKQRVQMNTSGLVMKDNDGKSRLQIGPLTEKDGKKIYGFAVKDINNRPVLFNLADTNNSGIIGITGSINILKTDANYDVSSPLLKIGYTSSQGATQNFQQATINIATEANGYVLADAGTATFNPEIIQLSGKYGIIGNADWQENVYTNYIQRTCYTIDNKITKAISFFGIEKMDNTYSTTGDGYLSAMVIPHGTYMEFISYTQSHDGSWFKYGLAIKPAGLLTVATYTGGNTSALAALAQRGFASGVALQPITCLADSNAPFLVFMGSNNKSQKGYIATEDNFICNELSCKILNSTTVSVTNISATTITTKNLSSGSSSEFLYIPDLSSYNTKFTISEIGTLTITNSIKTSSIEPKTNGGYVGISDLNSYNIKTTVIHNDDKVISFRSDINFGAADKKINVDFSNVATLQGFTNLLWTTSTNNYKLDLGHNFSIIATSSQLFLNFYNDTILSADYNSGSITKVRIPKFSAS